MSIENSSFFTRVFTNDAARKGVAGALLATNAVLARAALLRRDDRLAAVRPGAGG